MANLDKQHALGTAKESLLYVHYLLYSCQMEFLIQLFSFFYFIFNKAWRVEIKCKEKKKKNLPVYLLFNSDHDREHSLGLEHLYGSERFAFCTMFGVPWTTQINPKFPVKPCEVIESSGPFSNLFNWRDVQSHNKICRGELMFLEMSVMSSTVWYSHRWGRKTELFI